MGIPLVPSPDRPAGFEKSVLTISYDDGKFSDPSLPPNLAWLTPYERADLIREFMVVLSKSMTTDYVEPEYEEIYSTDGICNLVVTEAGFYKMDIQVSPSTFKPLNEQMNKILQDRWKKSHLLSRADAERKVESASETVDGAFLNIEQQIAEDLHDTREDLAKAEDLWNGKSGVELKVNGPTAWALWSKMLEDSRDRLERLEALIHETQRSVSE